MDTDEPQLVTVEPGNGTRTSGGRGPGQVQVPEVEARELVAQGLAVRCGAEMALNRYVVTARRSPQTPRVAAQARRGPAWRSRSSPWPLAG